jgi:hypothetical protein
MTETKANKKKMLRPKHIPQRTCIACRTHDAKRGLLRLVRTPEGIVEIDETGKKKTGEELTYASFVSAGKSV